MCFGSWDQIDRFPLCFDLGVGLEEPSRGIFGAVNPLKILGALGPAQALFSKVRDHMEVLLPVGMDTGGTPLPDIGLHFGHVDPKDFRLGIDLCPRLFGLAPQGNIGVLEGIDGEKKARMDNLPAMLPPVPRFLFVAGTARVPKPLEVSLLPLPDFTPDGRALLGEPAEELGLHVWPLPREAFDDSGGERECLGLGVDLHG